MQNDTQKAARPRELDEIDFRLLRMLDNDSRISLADLSAQTGATRDQVSYRLRALERDLIITRFTIAVNPFRVGFMAFKMYLVLEKGPQAVGNILAYLKKQPGVFWIAEGEGHWDLLFAAYARNPYDFWVIQDRLLTKFSRSILSSDVYTVVDSQFFPRKYLAPAPVPEFFLGGVPETQTIDSIDEQLLSLLADYSRTPITGLAEKLGISPTATTNRLARLEKEKIIAAYRIDLDLERLGYQSFKVQCFVRSFERYNDIHEYCREHPHILRLIRQLGAAMMEVELEARDFPHCQEIVADFRARFSVSIRTIPMKRPHYLWLPSTQQ